MSVSSSHLRPFGKAASAASAAVLAAALLSGAALAGERHAASAKPTMNFIGSFEATQRGSLVEARPDPATR